VSGAGGQGQGPVRQGSWRRHGRVVARRTQASRPPRGTFVFRDLNPGERIVWIRRQSYLHLLATAAPQMLGLLGLLGLRVWLGDTPGLPHVIQIVGWILLGLATLYWAATDLWNWFFQFYVLTDQRVVKSRGFFQRNREEIPLKSVAQVRAERPTVFYMLFGVGNVAVRPIGPEIELTGVAHPRDVADSILAVQENPNFGLPAAAPAQPARPGVATKKLQEAIDNLAQPAPLPGAGPMVVRAPFHSFLHRKIPIRLFEGEEVVEVVYRHWSVLVRDEIPALLITAVTVGAGLLLRASGGRGDTSTLLMIGGVLLGGLVGVLTYMNWADDCFVLTTHRVVDVDRLIFILNEYSNDAPYARIQEVRVQRNVVGRALGYGSIYIDTSGRKSTLQMSDIPHAFRVMDEIFRQINLQKERDAVLAQNKQKKENERWMAMVLHELVLQVPDVRGLRFVEATGQARKAGLKLVVDVERQAPGTAAGTVLDQVPGPGATALPESEVRVVLAGRP
jgi:membrane protein YdbS with pleckstrin-like domain